MAAQKYKHKESSCKYFKKNFCRAIFFLTLIFLFIVFGLERAYSTLSSATPEVTIMSSTNIKSIWSDNFALYVVNSDSCIRVFKPIPLSGIITDTDATFKITGFTTGFPNYVACDGFSLCASDSVNGEIIVRVWNGNIPVTNALASSSNVKLSGFKWIWDPTKYAYVYPAPIDAMSMGNNKLAVLCHGAEPGSAAGEQGRTYIYNSIPTTDSYKGWEQPGNAVISGYYGDHQPWFTEDNRYIHNYHNSTSYAGLYFYNTVPDTNKSVAYNYYIQCPTTNYTWGQYYCGTVRNMLIWNIDYSDKKTRTFVWYNMPTATTDTSSADTVIRMDGQFRRIHVDNNYVYFYNTDTRVIKICVNDLNNVSQKDGLVVTGKSTVPSGTMRGDTNVVVAVFRFQADNDSVEVNSIKIKRTGTLGDGYVTGVKIFVDANYDSKVSAGDTQLGTAQLFSGDSAVISGFSYTVNREAVSRVMVTYDIGDSAVTDATIGCGLDSSSFIAVTGSDYVRADTNPAMYPIASSLGRIGDNSMIFSGEDKAPVSSYSNNSIVLGVITLTSETNTVTVASLKLEKTGTAGDNEIAGVKLVEDADGDGELDAGENQVGNTKTFASGIAEIDNMNCAVNFGSAKRLLIVVTLGNTVLGNTIGVKIAYDTYFTMAGSNMARPYNFPWETGKTGLSPYPLSVSGESRMPEKINVGQKNVVAEAVTLTAQYGTISVGYVRIDKTGSIDDNGVDNIRLYDDNNSNGALDFGDLQIGDTNIFVSGGAYYTGITVTVQTGTPKKILVVADIKKGINPGYTFGIKLSDVNYLSPDGASYVKNENFPIQSGTGTLEELTELKSIDILKARTGESNGEAVLSWNAPSDADGISRYEIRRNSGKIDEWAEYNESTATADLTTDSGQIEYRVTNLYPGKVYYFSILRYDADERKSGLSNSPFARAYSDNIYELLVRADTNVDLILYNPKDENTKLHIPQGALKQNCYIHIEKLSGQDLNDTQYEKINSNTMIEMKNFISMYDFKMMKEDNILEEVDDRNFNKNVKMVIGYDEVGLTIRDELKLAVFNWGGNGWERVGGIIDIDKNLITAYTSHFSRYAVFVTVSQAGVKAEPSPFTPNRDGINDEAFFQFPNKGVTVEMVITIYDINGKVMKVLRNAVVGETKWDGRDSSGKYVESGYYIFTVGTSTNMKYVGSVIVAR